ncbi:MAG: ABC transporter permease [Anaeroplasmataceae bacterium]|nr:ABC transporter permease [Anaeroplasmataceae bacterium]
MRKLFLIACSNMRKAKGQTVAIVVLILLAAMLLNLWLMLSLDYKANFDRYHDKLNAEHVTLAVDDTDGTVYTFLTETLSNDTAVKEYRLDNCMHMVGTFPYNGGMMNGEFVFMDKQTATTRTIGKSEIIEDSTLTSGIYLPMIYKSNDYSVGKTIEISIGSHPVTYTICGFFNSMMLGSHNCALTQIILTADKYAELEELNYAPQTTLCSVRLNDKSINLNYESKLKASVSEQFPNTRMISSCYDVVVQARYIAQSICSVIVSVMAFFVLLIAIVVIISNIINHIQVNIKNLGALKAVGYTSKQLVCSLLLQFLGLTTLATIVGAVSSYAVFPAINVMMIAQTGIPYAIHFLPLPALSSLLILGGTVALSVWLASRRINKIEPIVALRSGVQTHNFKRNYVPLEKTKVPLNFALALKTTLTNVKHNITICITMLVLSLVLVFSGLMTENVIIDMTPFLDLIVGETADSGINVQIEVEGDFLAALNSDSRVEKVYLYNSVTIAHVDGADLLANICDDFSNLNNQRIIYKGRFPKYDNEIAIGAKYAKEKGFTVGNEIEITTNGNTQKYLISGLTQISNNLGRDCLLTRKGYERLGTLQNVTYYIELVESADIDVFNEEMKNNFEGNVNAVINILATMDAMGGVYVSLITIIVIAILVLSAIIIAFVLYLLVRTMLNNKKRDYGILKSLGFTTKQLILQTALSFMPTIVISTVIGIIVSCLAINPLMSLFLSGLGIVKCTFTIPILFSIIVGVSLVLFAFALLCLLSLKIKKISPYHILVGE